MAVELVVVPIREISPAKDNPRRKVGDVDELAASIRAVGLLEPLIVTNGGGLYQLVAGARRLAAAKQAGLTRVPVIVRELTESQRQEVMLIENLQRTDLRPLEEAEAFQRLLGLPGYSQRKLAERLGRSQSHVSKRLALLELPPKAQQLVDSGRITLEDAGQLAKLKDEPKRLERALVTSQRAWDRDVKRAVQVELDKLATEKRIRLATEKLKRAGVRVLSMVEDKMYRGTYHLPKGAIRIVDGGAHNALDLDPKKHKADPCHAAVIQPRHGDVIYVCTDRARHPKLQTQEERFHSGRRAYGKSEARTQHERDIREANKARHGFIRELLKRPRPRGRDEALEVLVVETLIGEAWNDKLKTACELLDVEPVRTTNSYGASFVNYADPLIDLARRPGQALRVGLAIRLAVDEATISKGLYYRGKQHFAWLAEHGYKASPAEKRALAGNVPE